MQIFAYILLLTFSLFVCASSYADDDVNALHLDWLDKNVKPGINFYKWANGGWQKKNPIPADHANWGTFHILAEKTQKNVRDILVEAANDKQAKPGSIEQKVGDFYFSGMDTTSINALGIQPLKPQLSLIQSINTLDDLQAAIAHLHSIGVDVFFDFSSMQDFKNSKMMVGAIAQSGLGLPDRDYYLKQDEKFKKVREAYVEHMKRMFALLGASPQQAAKNADIVMQIETSLAKSSLSQVAQRDPNAIYHMMDQKQLAKRFPNITWPKYFTAMGQSKINQVNIGMPDFITMVDQLLQTTPLENLKIYLNWHLIDAFAPYLSSPFVEENFRMLQALTGVQKLQPRWKRVVNTEEMALGFAIGQLYVKKYFSPAAKKEVLEILKNIRQELSTDLQTLSWMTPSTRKAALKKLSMMEERVGYPDKWRDYSKLMVNRGPYVLNIIRANQFLVARNLNKIDKPVDRSEWSMPPQMVNAYYDPSMNNINIPAGILQPPFFDPKAPAALNYGAIGFVIGHEMTHGFDDQGAKFNGKGNLKNWWSQEDLKKFQIATDCIVRQFSQYKVDGLHVQGKLVVGEATADLGGLTLASRAFRNSAAYKTVKTIAGFTPDQQFFIGAAHVWASNIRPELARHLLTIDPHPPSIYRVNGTLSNMQAFQEAFGVPNNSPMVKNNRCVIW